MPYSVRENDADVLGYVAHHGISTVLDIGPGSGTYADLLGHACTLDAVEAWPDYLTEFDLTAKYRHILIHDVRTVGDLLPTRYDLVIFGDVLEHMTPTEAADVWDWAPTVADRGLVSLPLDHWPQHAEHGGNPHEAHDEEHLTGRDLLAGALGPFEDVWVYDQTATFARRFV